MSTQTARCMTFTLILQQCTALAGDADRTRAFPELQCTLVLPNPHSEWLDHTAIPHASAAFEDSSGTMLIMVVKKAPEGFVLNESFSEGFDKAFCKPGLVSNRMSLLLLVQARWSVENVLWD